MLLEARVAQEDTREQWHRPDGEEIHIDDWDITRDVLWTERALTCTVLAALNQEDGVGLLGHFSGVAPGNLINSHQKFEEALEALAHFETPSATRIHLAGGGIYFRNANFEEVYDDRRYAESRITTLAKDLVIPMSAVNLDWLWGDERVDAAVDCQAGRIIVAKSMHDSVSDPEA